MAHNPKQTIKVLVVGDWIVDEHWITGQHRTTTSSRTSDDYCRVLSSPDSNIQSLCGAGLVASILSSPQTSADHAPPVPPNFEVWGLGLWHPADRQVLEQMLNPAFTNGRTHHRLSTTPTNGEVNNKLFSLNDLAGTDFFVGTTRVIRIYERHHGRPRLKQRIDWDAPLPQDKLDILFKNAAKQLQVFPQDITHIVVKDLGKGVVRGDLIEALVKQFSKARWYVSSKNWRPSWLNVIPVKNIAICLIPQVAAQLAINDSNTNVDCWLTPAGVPSKEALEFLRHYFPASRVVVLPDNSRLLAFDGQTSGYVQTASLPSDETKLTQMASVFLPALIAHQLRNPATNAFGDSLGHALAYTENWRILDQARLRFEGWTQEKQPDLHYDYRLKIRDPQWLSFNWGQMVHDWESASKDCGVITKRTGMDAPREELHLWRGMTELSGYISCIPEKRKHIQQILRDGRRFVGRAGNERKHQSYVIVDKPGSGKSYLIDRLAESLKMNVLKFNLTQLTGLQDLLACFDKIRSEQERHKTVPLLLFFDELNAKVGENYYLGGFLEPMDDGAYTQHGLAHRLLPAFWIFAGTEFPKTTSASLKVGDFESRLARKPMVLSGATGADDELHRVERVYMGVAAIRNVYQDVTQVSADVLWIFRNLEKQVGPRDITRIVRNCENVQYGRVGLEQMPADIGQYIQGDAAELDKRRSQSQRYITIIDEPQNWWTSADKTIDRSGMAKPVQVPSHAPKKSKTASAR